MNRDNFPLLAVALGTACLLVTSVGSRLDEHGDMLFPLLTLLALCEFGVLVTAAGALLSVQRMRRDGFSVETTALVSVTAILCLVLFQRGLSLWPG